MDGCIQPITATYPSYYACIQCDFFLHSLCACKLPQELPIGAFPFHPQHSLFLQKKSRFYDTVTCGICNFSTNGFYYECETCDIKIDIFCAFLPARIKHKYHPLVQRPSSLVLVCQLQEWIQFWSLFRMRCLWISHLHELWQKDTLWITSQDSSDIILHCLWQFFYLFARIFFIHQNCFNISVFQLLSFDFYTLYIKLHRKVPLNLVLKLGIGVFTFSMDSTIARTYYTWCSKCSFSMDADCLLKVWNLRVT